MPKKPYRFSISPKCREQTCGPPPPPACFACTCGKFPAQFTVVVAGMANGTCSQCALFDGTYILTQPIVGGGFGGLVYSANIPGTICGQTGWQINLAPGSCGGGDSWLLTIDAGSVGALFAQGTSNDCGTPPTNWTFTSGGSPPCVTTGASLTVTAQGKGKDPAGCSGAGCTPCCGSNSCELLTDRFARGDGDPGSNWKGISATWSIASHALVTSSSNAIILVAQLAPPSGAWMRVSAQGKTGDVVRLILGYKDPNNFLHADWTIGSGNGCDGVVDLYSRAGGTDTHLAHHACIFMPDRWTTLGACFDATSGIFTGGQAQAHNVTATGSAVGLGTGSVGGGDQVQFTNFTASAVGGPGTSITSPCPPCGSGSCDGLMWICFRAPGSVECCLNGVQFPLVLNCEWDRFEGSGGESGCTVDVRLSDGCPGAPPTLTFSCDNWQTQQSHTFSAAEAAGYPIVPAQATIDVGNCCGDGGPLTVLVGEAPPCSYGGQCPCCTYKVPQWFKVVIEGVTSSQDQGIGCPDCAPQGCDSFNGTYYLEAPQPGSGGCITQGNLLGGPIACCWIYRFNPYFCADMGSPCFLDNNGCAIWAMQLSLYNDETTNTCALALSILFVNGLIAPPVDFFWASGQAGWSGQPGDCCAIKDLVLLTNGLGGCREGFEPGDNCVPFCGRLARCVFPPGLTFFGHHYPGQATATITAECPE